jgi:hypothetical protein
VVVLRGGLSRNQAPAARVQPHAALALWREFG